ncbi:MAG: Multi-copper polyphenol oxidoreductase laccase, partial [Actinomycetota bacterium]
VGARAMSAVATSAAGAPSVDLAGAVRDELESLGVAVADRAPTCTRCASGWFSHRGDPRSGRQVGLIVRRGEVERSSAAVGSAG